MNHVVYACNDNYIEQTLISMASLLRHNREPYKIWIISDRIREQNRALLKASAAPYGAECEFLELEQVLEGVPLAGSSRHPHTVYAKLFLENRIDAERVLYLDSDTVVTGSLKELWNRSMDQELAAGVQMPYSPRLKARMGIRAGDPYLCDGVVLLHLKKWREQQVGEQCRAYIREQNGQPLMLSEQTLNYVCQGKLGILEPKYNLMSSMIAYSAGQICCLFGADAASYYSEQQLEEARKHPVLIHYLNELYNRPWLEPCDHPYREIYRQERRELLGERPYPRREQSRNTRITRLLRRALPFPVFAALYHWKHKDI